MSDLPRDRDEFSRTLHDAIVRSGLSLKQIQAELGRLDIGVGRSTLSVWQNGRRRPTGDESMRVLEALETIVDAAPGELVAAAQAADPATGFPRWAEPADVEPIGDLLAKIGCRGVPQHFDTRVTLSSAQIGPTGAVSRLDTHLVERAVRSTDRFAFIYGGEAGGDPGRVTVGVAGSLRLGRVAKDVELNLTACEIILPRPTRAGEHLTIRYWIEDRNTIPSTEFAKPILAAATFSGLEVTFHPDRLPVHVEEYERTDSPPRDTVRPVTLAHGSRVDLVRERAPKGIIGVRWRYAEP